MIVESDGVRLLKSSTSRSQSSVSGLALARISEFSLSGVVTLSLIATIYMLELNKRRGRSFGDKVTQHIVLSIS